jgi:hypothetical protein
MALITYIRQNPLLCLAYLLLAAGIVIVTFFIRSLSEGYTLWGPEEVDVAKTGAVGDFIAGAVGTLLSLTGLVLVLMTYRDQRLSNEKDKKEARIFALIQIHVNNADMVSYQNPYRHGRN